MMAVESIGKALIFLGIVMIFIGTIFVLFGKVPWFGRLPGDLVIKNENMTVYFPIATMLIISVILTVLFNMIAKR